MISLDLDPERVPLELAPHVVDRPGRRRTGGFEDDGDRAACVTHLDVNRMCAMKPCSHGADAVPDSIEP